MKALHGEGNSAESMYIRYAPVLLSICLRYCGNIADAEDVLHDGFIKILRNLSTFSPRANGTFEAWMKRIMVNTALNHIRDHSKEKKFLDIDPLTERISNEEPEGTWFDDLAGKISQDKIIEMICELPAGYRTVFNMFVFEDYSHHEIAEFLGCTENNSKSQLSKARGMLRKRLYQFYFKQFEPDEKANRQS
ncbi:MAG: RNA polymerase sigma factor [Bacteroidales bacterium]|jgi:RNA polymerase sigma-70 factor (ECF subfamily)